VRSLVFLLVYLQSESIYNGIIEPWLATNEAKIDTKLDALSKKATTLFQYVADTLKTFAFSKMAIVMSSRREETHED
jgi:hypothetical protein